MNKPFFDEKDIQTFFDSKQPKEVEVEKKPALENKDNSEVTMEIEFEPEIKPKMEHKQIPIQIKPKPEHEYAPLNPIKNHPSLNNVPPVSFHPAPLPPPMPKPGALPKIQNSYIGQYNYDRPSALGTVLKFLGIFVSIFIISFILLNGPAILKELNYFSKTKIQHQSFTSAAPTPAPIGDQSKLIIPQIQVNAPIIWNVAPEQITQNLENGVVHYQGTALPGTLGNIFITGHSSYYPWAAGNYKDVFALLGKLKTKDKIYLQYKGANFVYEVSEIKVVLPDDLSVLGSTNQKTLTLMTCVPVGTNLKRLIVTAKQIL